MWLRIRSLTLRLISGLPSLNHSVGPKNSEKTTENGVSSRIDIIRLLLQQLEVALETGKRFIEKEIQVSSVCVYHHMTPPPFFFFWLFRAALVACGSSQAGGRIGHTAGTAIAMQDPTLVRNPLHSS